MSSLKNTANNEDLFNSCNRILTECAKFNNIEIKVEEHPALTFNNLIKTLSKINQVVILIDEYDKPIIDNIDEEKTALQNKNFLRDFYSVIKDNDIYIKFCFLTGVSKFSKISIFGGLNNIKDISLDLRYSTICGISKNEIEHYFSDRFFTLSQNLNIDVNSIKNKIRQWYNGYSWDGVNSVYNPFSILIFFDEGLFKNYWFSSGTPTFLIKKFKEINYNPEETNNFKVTDTFFDSFEIESFDYRSLLFQTGYLTISNLNKMDMIYTLDYPNKEVRESFLSHLLTLYIKKEAGDLRYTNLLLQTSLQNNDITEFTSLIKSIVAGIPYQLHIPKEAYYHSLFYIILQLMGVRILTEQSTAKGRIDGIIETSQNIYIIELKYLDDKTNSETLLNKAINQIKKKEYFNPYFIKGKNIQLLAIALNKDILEYKVEII